MAKTREAALARKTVRTMLGCLACVENIEEIAINTASEMNPVSLAANRLIEDAARVRHARLRLEIFVKKRRRKFDDLVRELGDIVDMTTKLDRHLDKLAENECPSSAAVLQ